MEAEAGAMRTWKEFAEEMFKPVVK